MAPLITPPSSGSRSPQNTVLHTYIKDRFPTHFALRVGRGKAPYMAADVNAYLPCGDIRHSHATLKCFRCGTCRDIPLSCKRRGFCEPCAVRQQQKRTPILCDRFFGTNPVRMWTVTLPYPLRIDIGTNAKLQTAILNAVIKCIQRYIRLRIRREMKLSSIKSVYPAFVTVIHRTSRNLAPNVHFHILALDGAFVRLADGEPLTFVDLPPPPDNDIHQIAQDICRQVLNVLWRRDLWAELISPEGREITGYLARTNRALKRFRFTGVVASRANDVPTGVSAFNLSANRAVKRGDRKNLRKLIAYLLSPVMMDRQLQPDDSGMTITFRRARADGTLSIRYTDEEFFDKLNFLVPPRRANIIRFHGGFAPNCPLRAEMVPPLPPPEPPPADRIEETPEDLAAWSELSTHSFTDDMLRCHVCRGRLQLIALKTTRTNYRRRSGVPPDTPSPPATA